MDHIQAIFVRPSRSKEYLSTMEAAILKQIVFIYFRFTIVLGRGSDGSKCSVYFQTAYTYISNCKQDSNEIQTAIPMFSGSSYPIRIVIMLYDQTES